MKKILATIALLFCFNSYSVLWEGKFWDRTTWEQKEGEYVVYSQLKRVYIYGIKQFPVSVCVKNEFIRTMTIEAIDKFHRSYFRWVTRRSSWSIREHQHMIPRLYYLSLDAHTIKTEDILYTSAMMIMPMNMMIT